MPASDQDRRPIGAPAVGAGLAVAAGVLALLGVVDPTGPALVGLVSTGAAVLALVLVVLGRLLARSAHRGQVLTAELERLRGQVDLDPLTGLVNRDSIAAEIARRLTARRPGEQVAVLLCDLDRLRVINESLGHGAGDEVLAVAARRLALVVRPSDRIGRFGGDEFVIVTSGLPAMRDLEILAARANEALRQPVALADGTTLVVSGSVGIAVAADRASTAAVTGAEPGGGQATAAVLLRDAAVASQAAKRTGGDGHARFDEAERASIAARLTLEQELRAGLHRDEIDVHYQPIVDGTDGTVHRVEALIRWDHPRRGTILPCDFLPVAAESKLIVDLGRRVLGQACAQATAWTEALGRPISVAVNVGERQLLDPGLLDMVSGVLAATGLPPAQLELEIAEGVILDRFDPSRQVLRQLDLLGVGLAIDDVGTSRASLGRLEQLAMVSTLKIDRLLVDGIATDPVDHEIVAAVVALASGVGMTVVAEGVATAEQARALIDVGVDQLQGFLFDRPAPAGAVDAALGGNHRHHWA